MGPETISSVQAEPDPLRDKLLSPTGKRSSRSFSDNDMARAGRVELRAPLTKG